MRYYFNMTSIWILKFHTVENLFISSQPKLITNISHQLEISPS